MDDEKIVQLYWERAESAIAETDRKYGSYCQSIAYAILQNSQDAEECVSDTYLHAWNAMPPHRPSVLSTFLGKITRRLSIDRWRNANRLKRGGGQLPLALEELGECIPGGQNPEEEVNRRLLAQIIDRFLLSLSVTERRIFLQRYWYLLSIAQIAQSQGFSQSKVTSLLHRTRCKLRKQLEKEGLL